MVLSLEGAAQSWAVQVVRVELLDLNTLTDKIKRGSGNKTGHTKLYLNSLAGNKYDHRGIYGVV